MCCLKAALHERLFMAETVISQPGQEADFRWLGSADQGQLAAASGETRSRPFAGTRDRQLSGCPEMRRQASRREAEALRFLSGAPLNANVLRPA